MKKELIIFFMLLISVLFFNFTKNNTKNGEQPTMTDCDSTIVYFQQQILPILQSNCAKSGCHTEKDRKHGVVLNSYENLMRTVEFEEEEDDEEEHHHGRGRDRDREHDRGRDRDRERDRHSDNELVKVLQRNKMPPYPHKPLSTAQKNLIYQWVEQGMQNNSCEETVTIESNKMVSFTNDVFPIVQENCLGCHSEPNPSNGYDFSQPKVFQTIAKTGKVYLAISHADGATAMPFLGDKLPQTKIDLIKKWIDEGANLD